MTEGNIFSVMIRFAVPLLLTNAIEQLYSTVDMMIVGQVVGSAGTVGVSSGSLLPTLITCIGLAYGSAAQICAAQMSGADDRDHIGSMGCTILNAMLFLSVILMVITILTTGPMLRLLNVPEEAFSEAYRYMRMVALGFPFIICYDVLSGVMRGMGESKKPLYFIGISAAANVILDILLVAVIPLGALGSAAATVASQAISLLACLIYIEHSAFRNVFQLRKNRGVLKKRYLVPVTRLAIPLFLQYGVIHLSQLICNSWVNSFGLLAATTTSIGNKISQFIGIVSTSLSNAAGSVVAQNLGARKLDRVRKTVYAALALGAVICALECLISLAWPTQLFSLFSNDPEVIEFGCTFLRITVITYILNGIQGPYTSVITGSGNARLSLIYGIVDGIVLRLGISYILAFGMHMGVIGYWYGNAFAHLGPLIIAVVYFYGNSWAKRSLMSDEINKDTL